MHLFVTGASGFVGTAVLAEAQRRGHTVTGLSRSVPEGPDGAITWLTGDVRDALSWSTQAHGSEAVIHLAASLVGEGDELLETARLGTRNIVASNPAHIVLVSSFAVYDFESLPPDALVDERTPIEGDPGRRDAYCAAKLAQEDELGDAPHATILRPGLIWDVDHCWNAGIALEIAGRAGITIAANGRLPLVHVADAARAIVSAAELAHGPRVLNLVADHCPTRREFATAIRRSGRPVPSTVGVPYVMAAAAARSASLIASALGVKSRLPGLARPAQVAARFKPLRYSNAAASAALGWQPRVDVATGLARPSQRGDDRSR